MTQGDLSFLQGQKDPMIFLMQQSVNSNNIMTDAQASESTVLMDASNGASEAISSSNNYLETLANAMSACTGDNASNEMTSASTQYQVAQTVASNRNNEFSNGMQGLGTVVSNYVPAEQFVLQFCQSTVDFMNGVDQCVRSWASG